MNSWNLSWLCNLRAAGIVWATAKATVLTGVATDQTVAGLACEAAKADNETLAALAYGARAGNVADSIGYCANSPGQTYADI